MQSNNPVLRRSEEFAGTSNAYGNATYAGNGQAHAGYGQAPTSPVGQETGFREGPVGTGDRMTIDSVVQKSAISVGLVFVAAFLTWAWIGDVVKENVVQDDALSRAYLLSLLGAGGAFILSLVNSFKRVISPALVMAFAVAEGVALGALSMMFEARWDGIVTQAVLGTFAAFAGTLAAYKFFDIKVGQKFRTFVIAGMFGMVGLGLMSLVLSFFGIDTGIFGFGTTGLIFAIAGLVLGVFMLILDFDLIENGVRAGIPERESWRAAFGLTVSLVWIYTNLLRILAIMRGD